MQPLQDEGTLSRDGNFENLFGRKKTVIETIKRQDLKGTLSARFSFSTATASSAATSSVAASSASSSATAFSSSATVVESENLKAQNFTRPKEKDEVRSACPFHYVFDPFRSHSMPPLPSVRA